MYRLYRFSHEYLMNTVEKSNLSAGKISTITKSIDPTSKGVSRTSILNTISGKSVPSADTLAMICAALEISPKSNKHWIEIQVS